MGHEPGKRAEGGRENYRNGHRPKTPSRPCGSRTWNLETPRRAATAVSSEDDGIPEADAVERLTALKKALGALQAVNRSLTRDVLARSAVGPAQTLDHEDIVHAILTETIDIRGKALRAHNY
ncbi:hypothetical protein AB0D04_13310 [Streptomyces sp. NPDC048483]|uniref:hypothetical protein n=1 Tax=Streptomyces sp. NPDC048483 TaxID=3154927 RepID=UPI00341E9403